MIELKVICAFCNKLQSLNLSIDPNVPLKDGGGIWDCTNCKSFVGELIELKNKENLNKLA